MSNYTDDERRTADGPGLRELQQAHDHRFEDEVRLSLELEETEKTKTGQRAEREHAAKVKNVEAVMR